MSIKNGISEFTSEPPAKVKVSDSVGDKRVYGVVDTFTAAEKVNVTAVGIASVLVTGACAGGDLLESNGDGTAKVQDDDIIRSKTVAKVNSNVKIETYADGSYVVPCTLHC